MIVNNQHKFIFVHVYRTGGTSIDKAFGGNNHKGGTHTALETVPNWKDYFSFAFVRNPWDRVVSAYHMHKTKGKAGKTTRTSGTTLATIPS